MGLMNIKRSKIGVSKSIRTKPVIPPHIKAVKMANQMRRPTTLQAVTLSAVEILAMAIETTRLNINPEIKVVMERTCSTTEA